MSIVQVEIGWRKFMTLRNIDTLEATCNRLFVSARVP